MNITSSSSSATFLVRGSANDISDPSPIDGYFVGTFTTQFTTQPYQTVLATVLGGGTVTASYSANFSVTAIPEPATMSFLGIGLVLIGEVVLKFAGLV